MGVDSILADVSIVADVPLKLIAAIVGLTQPRYI